MSASTELVTVEEMNETAYLKQVAVRSKAVEVAAKALRSGSGWGKSKAGHIEDIIALSEYILTGAIPDYVEEGPPPPPKEPAWVTERRHSTK